MGVPVSGAAPIGPIRAGFVFLCLLTIAATTGCGPVSSRSPSPRQTIFSAVAPSPVPASVSRLAAVMEDAYLHGDWSEVRGQFAQPSTGSSLVASMQMWKGQDISRVAVSVAYARRVGAARYVVTLRLGADNRTIPDYRIFLCSTAGKVARILGRAGKIPGRSYRQANWDVTRTQHFLVYHSPYQLVGTDRIYLRNIEHQRALFAARFKVRLPAMATYYLYPSQAEMRRLTGGGCGARPGEIGCTSPFSNPPTIQATLQATYHEPIHVYELALLPSPSHGFVYLEPLFIAEGTAVALEDRELDPRLSDYCSNLDYAPLDECAREAVRDVDPVTLLSDRGFKHADAGEAYALGGSFVKYLILHGGYPRFGRFYHALAAQPNDSAADYDVASRSVYGKPIRTLLSEWKSDLCRSGC